MNIGLFFSAKISLKDWLRNGISDRELDVYIELSNFNNTIYLFTYGIDDMDVLNNIFREKGLNCNIKVVNMPKLLNSYLGKTVYQFIMPFIHGDKIKKLDLMKTNQIEASIPVILSKIFYKKNMYLRCGYVLSDFLKKQNRIFRFPFWYFIEKISTKMADAICVSSLSDEKYLKTRHINSGNSKIYVNANYVNLDKFYPSIQYRPITDSRILYVGRFSNQKNLQNTLLAIKSCNLSIDLYGWGELEESLQAFVLSEGIDARFLGKVKNDSLPHLMENYSYYLLCSHFEGTPKTLLEAMSCGKVCIVSDVPGITEITKNNYNGLKAKSTEKDDISNALESAKELSEGQYSVICSNARKSVVNYHSFNTYIKKELKIYSEFL